MLLALSMLLARIDFVVARMILLLFPAVTIGAAILITTAVGVAPDEVLDFPILAKLFLIVVKLRLPPQVLPVVSINTIFLIMIFAPWTPSCLKVKDIEIRILWFHLMEHVDGYLLFGVSKCAHLAILTVLHVVWICLAKLTLILLGMVELFHPVVRLEALLPVRYALVVSCTGGNLTAHLTSVGSKSASTILLVVVIVEASLRIVLRLSVMLHQKGTRLSLELC